MKVLAAFFVICYVMICSTLSIVRSFDLNIPVEHSVDGTHFTVAGSLQGSLFDLGVSRGEQLTLLRNDLTSQEQQSLVELVRRNGMYKVRMPSDPNADSPKLLTSIPARCLVSTGLQDHLQLHATSSGKFVGLNYDYARHPCFTESDVAMPSDLNFPQSSAVPVWLPVAASSLQKTEPTFAEGLKGAAGKSGRPGSGAPKDGKAGDEKPPVEDNRHWLVKNWMIALPLAFVAINVFGAVMGPQEAAEPAGAPVGRRR